MNLLLTSNGLEGKLGEIAVTLLKKPIKENKVVFVTTAAYGEAGWDPKDWLEGYKLGLTKAGFTNIVDVDLRNMTQEELEKLFDSTDVVFVNGGNTFFLLYWARKSGFEKVLEKFLAKGKLYIGVSSGSIICCPTIETALYDLGGDYTPDVNNVGITDMKGFHFVPFLISPHFEENYRALIESQTQHASFPLVNLTNQQAILVQDSSVRLVGEGQQVLLKNTKHVAIPK